MTGGQRRARSGGQATPAASRNRPGAIRLPSSPGLPSGDPHAGPRPGGRAAGARWPLGRWPFTFITGVFAAGLVLPVWWLVTRPPAGLPGLGAYPSAYLGDSLLLPAGCLVLLLGIRALAPARRERPLAAVAAAVAAAAAVAVQAEWLEDPTTPPNWTMPHPGHLDAAGWWHAAYFTGMSMILLVLATTFLARVWSGRRAGDRAAAAVSSGTGAAAVLAAWGSYAALAIHDDFSGTVGSSSSISSFTLVGTVLLMAAVLVAVAYGRLAAVLARPALAAAGAIAVITSLVTAPVPARIGVAAALVAGAAVTAILGRRRLPPQRHGPASAAPAGSRRRR